MRVLQFIFRYIIELIKENPGKLISWTVIIILFNIAINIDNEVTYYRILETFESNNKYIYVVDTGGNGIKVLNHNESLKKGVGEIIIKYDVDGFVIALGFIIVLGSLFTLFVPIEDNGKWNFKDVYWRCCVMDVIIGKDVNHIYYVYRNKVITVYDRNDKLYDTPRIDRYNLGLYIRKMKENPNLYDDYSGTKAEIRNNKIKDIVN